MSVAEPALIDLSATIWGLDWSGAEHPGKAAWVARARWTGAALEISALESLATWSGAPELDRRGMVDFLLEQLLAARDSGEEPVFVGIDAPFSLEASERRALGATRDLALVDRLPLRCADPEALRAAVQRAAEVRQDGSKERRRPIDDLARTPLAPGNLRLYKQTWTALLLAHSLRQELGTRLLPWQPPLGLDPEATVEQGAPPPTHLLEICPASLWRVLDLEATGYKGSGEGPRARRAELLHGLGRALPLDLSESLAEAAVEQTGGDALDALAVAVGVVLGCLALSPTQHTRLSEVASELGGWVYAGVPTAHIP